MPSTLSTGFYVSYDVGVDHASDVAAFLLAGRRDDVGLDTIEIFHPNISKTYYFVRNAPAGITAILEDGESVANFRYCPMSVKFLSDRQDVLDQGISVQLGDLGKQLPKELQAIEEEGGFMELPTIKYRLYVASDLTKPIKVLSLRAVNIARRAGGVAFDAKAPTLNVRKTGTLYSIDQFPTLEGFQYAG